MAKEREYVTSAVSVFENDGIVVHVVNDDAAGGTTQIVIFQNTGAGAITAVDTGIVNVLPNSMASVGFTISESGEYWVRVRASSEFLIPKASFERGGTPVVSYLPGDFAVFKRSRKRIW